MCNLYTNNPDLTAWAKAFDEHLSLYLELSAGSETLANQAWATTVYPK